ncbi:MAG: glucose-1-phosphate adenylyltransferase [Proteobacteria bacterium]|nr:glucose-1-phosphate adenylyltransferase [Pseudomonadota bacterium]MBU1686105.1 glucose-1-phosphate adenylyltransferase [Pseudomonadota bacterium]
MKLKNGTLALILAGGRVDELNVLTYYRPKSAVPFGGFARIIDFSLSNLMNSGLERVAILSQYRNYSLINHIGIGASWDMIGRNRGVTILPPFKGSERSSWYRGTADAVFQNLDFIQYHKPEVVLILSGDHVYNMDYREIIAYHRDCDADLTVGCLQVPLDRAHRFGVAEIGDESGEIGGRVLRYAEKPEKPEFNWASMTVYCFKPQALYEALTRNAHEDDSFEFGRDIVPGMLAEGRRLFGFKFHDYWGYTRTVDEYWQTSMDLLGDSPLIKLDEWGLRTNLEHRAIGDFQPLKVGRRALIENSMVYNGCVVEGEVSGSILFPGVKVMAGARVKDSILFFNDQVGENAYLDKVISDVNVSFGRDCRIGGNEGQPPGAATVIGWSNAIPAGTVIGRDCTLYPHLEEGRLAGIVNDGEIIR